MSINPFKKYQNFTYLCLLALVFTLNTSCSESDKSSAKKSSSSEMSQSQLFQRDGLALEGMGHVPADPNPAYNMGKFFVVGGYTLNKENIASLNEGLPINLYGTTTMLNDQGEKVIHPLTKQPIVIRDQHYRLIDWGKSATLKNISEENKSFIVDPSSNYNEAPTGIRVIPITNGYYGDISQAPISRTGGEGIRVRGSEILDRYLREKVYGYTGELLENGPIYAQIVYYHPELHHGTLEQFPKDPSEGGLLKTEMGMTHKGAYFGKGHTRNSPDGYHGDTWFGSHDINYPAILHVMDFKGAVSATNGQFKPELFNLNAQISNLILNYQVSFPGHEYGYKFDPVYTITLKNTLDYYKRWLEGDETLKTDVKYQVYCAEHITMAINLALNLPQNLEGYKKVYGDADGARLWSLAKDMWATILEQTNASDIVDFRSLDGVVDDTYKPMWELLGEANPYTVIEEDSSYATVVGRSLGWRAETVAELARDFVSTYARWSVVGPTISTLGILGFSGQAELRMGTKPQDYFAIVTPIVKKIFEWDTATRLALDPQGTNIPSMKAAYAEDLNQKLSKLMPDEKNRSVMITTFLSGLDNQQTIMALATGITRNAERYEATNPLAIFNMSYGMFQKDVQENMKEVNKIEADRSGGAYRVKWYYPPATHVRVANGTHDPKSEERKFFRNYPVASVLLAEQTEPVSASNQSPWINESYVTYDIYGDDEVINTEGGVTEQQANDETGHNNPRKERNPRQNRPRYQPGVRR